MTQSLAAVLDKLPGLSLFGGDEAGVIGCVVPDREYLKWLVAVNGATAFHGALRFFPAMATHGMRDVCSWNSAETWKSYYGVHSPDSLLLFAEDAFGVQFGFESTGSVSIFWSETGEIEPLEIGLREFLERVLEDPDGTISLDFYLSARDALGAANAAHHYALQVETALGGELAVDNLLLMDSVMHMRSLGKIAQQLRDIPEGTAIRSVTKEPEES